MIKDLPAEFRPDRPDRTTFGDGLMLLATAVMTGGSLGMIPEEPVWGVIGALFFGFGLYAQLFGHLWTLARRRSPGPAESLAPFGRTLRRGNPAGYGSLLRVLAGLQGRRRIRRRRSAAMLEFLAAQPALRAGLFHHAHRGELDLSTFVERLAADPRDPLVAALSSLHADGRVRERAVAAMASAPHRGHVPFLVERAVEWAPQVRSAALTALRDQLAAGPLILQDLRREYARVERRRHAPGVAELLPAG
ncbi:hypothetical protein [Hamadaea tsunoensis]|uniref:hypothetical protein n=1 Tax=Hamadaea tsunoensis TaxID=53368 RepID=UPI000421B5CD|nr:hypothetical protein [Hamadaea tsunoensis]